MPTTDPHAWLLVIDLQTAFAAPERGWSVVGYEAAAATTRRLVDHFPGRVAFTRFVRDPAEIGAWAAYYDRWSDYRLEPDDPAWRLDPTTEPAAGPSPVVDAPTFSKWTAHTRALVGSAPVVLCGVATECCVLATALDAADDGHQVTVVSDACAGATEQLHESALGIMDANRPLIRVVTSQQLLATGGPQTVVSG